MKNLKNKRVLVTGGARGIGLAIASGFAKGGASVFLADVNGELAHESAEVLKSKYQIICSGYQADVSSCESIKELFDSVNREWGGLDILINNAGVQIRQPSAEFEEMNWDRLMQINLKGAFYCAQAAAKIMKQGGAIVNISSGTSVMTTPGRAPYVISKAGINAMTAVLAAEWAGDNIRLNAVAPGWIMTDMVKDGICMGIVSEKQILSAVPMKRLADPGEIADVVIFLASDEASYVTGQTLFVDGGWSALGLPDIEL